MFFQTLPDNISLVFLLKKKFKKRVISFLEDVSQWKFWVNLPLPKFFKEGSWKAQITRQEEAIVLFSMILIRPTLNL